MCGICGIVSLRDGEIPELDLIRRMIGRLRHRGPDSSGYYRDRHVCLGHARLSIIDLSGGAQPLGNEDGTVWVTYNGEIFNYVELQAELMGKGHRFRTKSDTEVIVHAYEEWGTECFRRFNGQWAVCLWDTKPRRLMLSRDRVGVRPLYYTIGGDRLLFASEVKALFADPALPRALDPEGLAEILSFWCPVAPRTSFAGVRQVEPGETLELVDTRLVSHRHWALTFPPAGSEPEQSLARNAKRLRDELIEASRLRFVRSDVPVGAYLSGGIDSSVTSAIVARYTDAPLTTYAIRFTDAEFDEGRYQEEMAARLSTDHREVAVSAANIGEVFPTVVWHAETPLLRTAPAPLYLLSRLVREHGQKVVVTGEGSDEFLAGYDIYREAKVRLFWSRDPSSRRRPEILARLYPWMERAPGDNPAFARAFFGRALDPADPGFSHRPRWESAKTLRALLAPDLKRSVDASRVEDELLARMPPEHRAWDALSRAQWLEAMTLLPGYILASQGDRMLMANSVEGRFPFLDRSIVELGSELPARHKLMGLREKHVLKVACADLVPEAILRRPKQPYRAPDAASFFSRPLEWLKELLDPAAVSDAGLFEPSAVAAIVAKCRSARGAAMSNADNMRAAFVVSASLVHSQYVRGNGGGPSLEEPPEPVAVRDCVSP